MSSSEYINDVIAVVVTYNPCLKRLEEQYQALFLQVNHIVYVDNSLNDVSFKSTEAFLNFQNNQKTTWIFLNKNFGVGKALNTGIQWALDHKAQFVILLDHDSVPACDMVGKLICAQSQLPPHSVVGPRYKDERQQNPPPFLKVKNFRQKRCLCLKPDEVTEVDCLITSGTLMPISAFKIVGGMREELFVDYIDLEWGLRAQSKGVKCYGVCNALMEHSLGDEPIVFLWKRLPLHSPLRHYYLIRNAILLYYDKNISLQWKWIDAQRLILKFVFYSLFSPSPYKHFKMMTKGFFHGLMKKSGEYIDN
jgi:rhamnosyltransferase